MIISKKKRCRGRVPGKTEKQEEIKEEELKQEGFYEGKKKLEKNRWNKTQGGEKKNYKREQRIQ